MEGFWKPLQGRMWYSIISLATLVILLEALKRRICANLLLIGTWMILQMQITWCV